MLANLILLNMHIKWSQTTKLWLISIGQGPVRRDKPQSNLTCRGSNLTHRGSLL